MDGGGGAEMEYGGGGGDGDERAEARRGKAAKLAMEYGQAMAAADAPSVGRLLAADVQLDDDVHYDVSGAEDTVAALQGWYQALPSRLRVDSSTVDRDGTAATVVVLAQDPIAGSVKLVDRLWLVDLMKIEEQRNADGKTVTRFSGEVEVGAIHRTLQGKGVRKIVKRMGDEAKGMEVELEEEIERAMHGWFQPPDQERRSSLSGPAPMSGLTAGSHDGPVDDSAEQQLRAAMKKQHAIFRELLRKKDAQLTLTMTRERVQVQKLRDKLRTLRAAIAGDDSGEAAWESRRLAIHQMLRDMVMNDPRLRGLQKEQRDLLTSFFSDLEAKLDNMHAEGAATDGHLKHRLMDLIPDGPDSEDEGPATPDDTPVSFSSTRRGDEVARLEIQLRELHKEHAELRHSEQQAKRAAAEAAALQKVAEEQAAALREEVRAQLDAVKEQREALECREEGLDIEKQQRAAQKEMEDAALGGRADELATREAAATAREQALDAREAQIAVLERATEEAETLLGRREEMLAAQDGTQRAMNLSMRCIKQISSGLAEAGGGGGASEACAAVRDAADVAARVIAGGGDGDAARIAAVRAACRGGGARPETADVAVQCHIHHHHSPRRARTGTEEGSDGDVGSSSSSSFGDEDSLARTTASTPPRSHVPEGRLTSDEREKAKKKWNRPWTTGNTAKRPFNAFCYVCGAGPHRVLGPQVYKCDGCQRTMYFGREHRRMVRQVAKAESAQSPPAGGQRGSPPQSAGAQRGGAWPPGAAPSAAPLPTGSGGARQALDSGLSAGAGSGGTQPLSTGHPAFCATGAPGADPGLLPSVAGRGPLGPIRNPPRTSPAHPPAGVPAHIVGDPGYVQGRGTTPPTRSPAHRGSVRGSSAGRRESKPRGFDVDDGRFGQSAGVRGYTPRGGDDRRGSRTDSKRVSLPHSERRDTITNSIPMGTPRSRAGTGGANLELMGQSLSSIPSPRHRGSHSR